MAVLGVVWLVLLVLELTRGFTPPLEVASTVIWVLFLGEFALKLLLAPARGRYLRREWLTALSLLVPALRVFRVARVVRVLAVARGVRGLRLVRVVTSVNRGIRSVGRVFRRRGAGYVALLTT
ncbi:MAG: potassium channel protein, partial [Myxococcota bacterium]